MHSITVDILNEKALDLLKKLEELNLVRVTETKVSANSEKKASDYKGILSDEMGDRLQQYVKQSRSEWQ